MHKNEPRRRRKRKAPLLERESEEKHRERERERGGKRGCCFWVGSNESERNIHTHPEEEGAMIIIILIN